MLNDSRNRRPTLRHVAIAAGVSRSTASNVLRGNGNISPETRERVLAVARALNYRVNRDARKLRTGADSSVGLLIEPDDYASPPHINDFWPLATWRILEALAEPHLGLVLLPPTTPPEGIGTDIVVSTSAALADAVREAELADLRLAFYSDAEPPADTWTFGHDHRAAATRALTDLRNQGHDRIALRRSEPVGRQEAMHQAYLDFCLANGISPNVVEADDTLLSATLTGVSAVLDITGNSISDEWLDDAIQQGVHITVCCAVPPTLPRDGCSYLSYCADESGRIIAATVESVAAGKPAEHRELPVAIH